MNIIRKLLEMMKRKDIEGVYCVRCHRLRTLDESYALKPPKGEEIIYFCGEKCFKKGYVEPNITNPII